MERARRRIRTSVAERQRGNSQAGTQKMTIEFGRPRAASDTTARLLTHVPLLQVPYDCVNVHGHVHQKESPSRNRHINVSVEQLHYRPAKLSDIRRLARRLLEGRTVPGHSTRARLNVVERIMP